MVSQPIQLISPLTGSATLDDVAMRLHPADEVAIAKVPLGSELVLTYSGGQVTTTQTIPVGHKFALSARATGEPVHRYGQIIGFAKMPIRPGDHVHTHNLGVAALQHEYAFGEGVCQVAYVPEDRRRTFKGFRRADGRVGTRNYVAIISSVNCSASVSRYVAERFRGDALHAFPHVDGVVALTHKGGCGAHYGGAEVDVLQRTLAGFARHPNVAGYILMGLGCEVNQIPDLVERQGLDAPTSFVIQEEGGLVDAVEAGVRAISEILPEANGCRRVEIRSVHRVDAVASEVPAQIMASNHYDVWPASTLGCRAQGSASSRWARSA